MNDYETETKAATDMLCEACALNGMWTRAERLAEAQVHATLAVAAAAREVAAAVVAGGAGGSVTANYEIRSDEYRGGAYVPDSFVRSEQTEASTCRICEGPILITQFIAALYTGGIAHLDCLPTFTGAEWADEVGA